MDEEPIKHSDVLVEDPEEIKKHAKKLEKFFVKVLKQRLKRRKLLTKLTGIRRLKESRLYVIKLPEKSWLYVIKLPEELKLFVIKLPEES